MIFALTVVTGQPLPPDSLGEEREVKNVRVTADQAQELRSAKMIHSLSFQGLGRSLG